MALACNNPKGKGEWEMEKVKGLFTRFATMFIALMCVLGMGTPIFADNKIPATGTFTIGGLDTSSEVSGIQINAYQIISVNVDDNHQAANPLYIWDDSVASWMTNDTNKGAYGSYVNAKDAGEETEVDYVAEDFKKQVTAGAVTTGVSQETATKFYEELAAEIRKSNGSEINITPITKGGDDIGEGGTAKFDYMAPGVYLITVTGGVKTYQPTVVTLLPTYSDTDDKWTITPVVGIDGSTNVKSANPTITKTVADTNKTVSVGETVNYTLDITVPDYPIDSANRYFTVEDTMPDGITYTDNSVSVSYVVSQDNSEMQTITINPTEGDGGNLKTYYIVTDVVDNTPAKGFKITFTNEYFAEYGDVRNITVTYKGTVVKAGFENNPDKLENTATLTYSTNPYVNVDEIDPSFTLGVLKSVSASVRVYSYRIQINKVNKEGTPLAGAEFQIYTKTETGISKDPLKFTGNKGSYILASSSESNPVTNLQVTDLTTEGETTVGGTLLIKGLDVGTYVIKEVVAPEGYVLPDGQLEVTITDSAEDGTIDTAAISTKTGSFELYTANDTSDGTQDGVYITNTGAGTGIISNPETNPDPVFKNTVTIDVLNTRSDDADFTLPSTGGMGTLIFTVGGLFVMAGAVVLAVVMYKKKNA